MTALFSARRRADELASALDNPHRDVDAELRELVGVVGALRRTVDDDPFATPRADFAADLRARLMAEAVDVLEPGASLVLPSRPTGRRERRLVSAAAPAALYPLYQPDQVRRGHQERDLAELSACCSRPERLTMLVG